MCNVSHLFQFEIGRRLGTSQVLGDNNEEIVGDRSMFLRGLVETDGYHGVRDGVLELGSLDDGRC